MIRVLHILSNLDINAGVMSVVMNYYRHIDRNAIQFDFAYFFEVPGTYKEEIQRLGGRYFFIGKPSFSISFQRTMKHFFDSHNSEWKIVHCHPIWAAEVIAPQAKKHGIKHVIQHSHSTRYGNNSLSEIRNTLIVSALRLFATDYAACSEEAGKLLRTKKSITILPNAIDCSRFTYNADARKMIRSEFRVPQNYTIVGHVGRFTAEKNQKFLIDVFNEIRKYSKDSLLVFVGDGALRKETEEYAAAQGLKDSIVFTGKREDVPDILSAFDVFVLPSKYEGVPFSVVEALASGLPCVISDTITRTVASERTFYENLGADLKIWAERILTSASMKRNREYSNEVKKLGFDIETEAKKMEDLYLNLLSGSR